MPRQTTPSSLASSGASMMVTVESSGAMTESHSGLHRAQEQVPLLDRLDARLLVVRELLRRQLHVHPADLQQNVGGRVSMRRRFWYSWMPTVLMGMSREGS